MNKIKYLKVYIYIYIYIYIVFIKCIDNTKGIQAGIFLYDLNFVLSKISLVDRMLIH